MWVISEKAYGTGAFFKALVEHNRDRVPTPHDLTVGTVVLTPDVVFLRRHYPSLCPKPRHYRPETPATTTVGARGGRTYLVEEGDTLSIIARYELGDGDRWREIYQLNRAVLGDDPNHLRPGMRLVLPSRSKPAPITRRPAPAIRRL
jgi:nucleoid-associated protein YgaU